MSTEDRAGGFERFSNSVSTRTGHPAAAMAALGVVVVWAVLGPLFGFSDTWQLVINTGTTIATFLMVFVIQNSLNRGNKALQLKLDELIRTSVDARDVLVGVQDLSEREIDRLEAEEEADARREDQDRAPRA
jgi:low affinity Fe/Cu permease